MAERNGVQESVIAALRTNLRGRVITAADGDYDEARKVWNGMIDRRPVAIARVAGAADVMTCVNLSGEHGIRRRVHQRAWAAG